MKSIALIACGFILGGIVTAKADFYENGTFRQLAGDIHQIASDLGQIRRKYERDSCR